MLKQMSSCAKLVFFITQPKYCKIVKNAFAGADLQRIRDKMKPSNSIRRTVVVHAMYNNRCAFGESKIDKSNDKMTCVVKNNWHSKDSKSTLRSANIERANSKMTSMQS